MYSFIKHFYESKYILDNSKYCQWIPPSMTMRLLKLARLIVFLPKGRPKLKECFSDSSSWWWLWTDHHIKKESNKKHGKFLSSYDYSTEISRGGTRASELVKFMFKGFPIKTRCQSFSTYIIFREEITARESTWLPKCVYGFYSKTKNRAKSPPFLMYLTTFITFCN